MMQQTHHTVTNLERFCCEIGSYCSNCRSSSTGGHRLTSWLDSGRDDWLSVPMSRPRPSCVANPWAGALPSVCMFNILPSNQWVCRWEGRCTRLSREWHISSTHYTCHIEAYLEWDVRKADSIQHQPTVDCQCRFLWHMRRQWQWPVSWSRCLCHNNPQVQNFLHKALHCNVFFVYVL